MKSLKSYFAPVKDNKKPAKAPSITEKPVSHAEGLAAWEPPTPRAYSIAETPSGRPSSQFPRGDFRNSTTAEINEIKCNVMANWLHSQQEERLWTAGESEEGVVLKQGPGAFTCAPQDLAYEPAGFFSSIEALNVRVAMTVNTRVIKILLLSNQMPYIEIEPGLHLQVLPDMPSLAQCQKHQFAAFIAERGLLVVWEDDPKKLLPRAARLEEALMKMVWKNASAYPEEDAEKKEPAITAEEVLADLENPQPEKPRRVVLIQPVLTACTIILVLFAMGSGWRELAIEVFVDRNFIRLAFLALGVPQMWLMLFFFQALVGNVAQLIGPIGQMKQNTKFYSGVAPRRMFRSDGSLPHVTIQCPVYKEGLHSVIEPTVRSLKAAISTYELQGGTANIFVNDDGMQLLSDEDAQTRQEFYDEHNIGWVARPKHNPKPAEGELLFVRRGKFKKASNMNYAMWVSNRVEERLSGIARAESWSDEDERLACENALTEIIEEDEGRTWAAGNVRMGDYLLLVDSDTRVPTDCFLDAVSEMEQSPEVAILQHSSGVMNVTDSFFEKGITFFTNLVYTQIQYAVANGDVAPFVGHNAVLRWSALQEIAYECPDDHREKFWSEATVSEDFDMALRLQTRGYVSRLAAYTGDGYKEGVSLTVYDELNRWEKYAYGCSELIFHPLRYWPMRGPFTPLFRKFILSSMPLPSKFTIMAYVGTYYALGVSWILTIANYFLTGWYIGVLDKYYVDSFKIYFAIVVVFSALGNVSLAVLRYRAEEKVLYKALIENFQWIPLLVVFLGGVSLHVSQALLSHLFSVDMNWGATAKEVENISFFEEIPRVLKRFKVTLIACILLSAMMVYLAEFVSYFWQIKMFIAIWPLTTLILCHFLLPIALNPNLMLFTW